MDAGCIRESGSQIELRGEFDLYDLDALSRALGSVPPRDDRVVVDLSGVTFMDVRCARRLAAWHALRPDLLELRSPSWQVGSSLAACGLSGLPDPPGAAG